MHYYQHNVGDYRKDTGHLSLLEHGVYRQLLDWYYLNEQPIPSETQAVCRRLSARTQEETEAVVSVLSDFFDLTEEGYVHGRCAREIDAYHGKADTARVNGKLGGRPKKTQVVSDRNPEVTQTKANGTYAKANHKPLTINQEPEEEKSTRKRAPPPLRPDDVDEQVWQDWTEHRKRKGWSCSETVIKQARRDAEKARMSLNDFLMVWCMRGTQGLQWDWIKPEERNRGSPGESDWQRSQRERVAEFSPAVARKPPDQRSVIDVEILSVPSIASH